MSKSVSLVAKFDVHVRAEGRARVATCGLQQQGRKRMRSVGLSVAVHTGYFGDHACTVIFNVDEVYCDQKGDVMRAHTLP